MLHVCAEEDMPPLFLGPWCKDTIISLGCALEPRLGRTDQHSRIQPEAKRAELSDWCGHGEKGLNLGEKPFPRHEVREQDTLKTSMYYLPIRCQQPLFWSITKHLCFPFSEKNPPFSRASGLCTDISATQATQMRLCLILKSSETSSGGTRPWLARP